MHMTTLRGIARVCRAKGAYHTFATFLLACCVLAFATDLTTVAAQALQDSKQPASTQSTPTPASPAAAEPAPQNSTPVNACASPAPSSGKALVCVYRQSRALGSAAHRCCLRHGENVLRTECHHVQRRGGERNKEAE